MRIVRISIVVGAFAIGLVDGAEISVKLLAVATWALLANGIVLLFTIESNRPRPPA